MRPTGCTAAGWEVSDEPRIKPHKVRGRQLEEVREKDPGGS